MMAQARITRSAWMAAAGAFATAGVHTPLGGARSARTASRLRQP